MGSKAEIPLQPSLPLSLGKKVPLDGLKALIQACPSQQQHHSGGQNTKCWETRRRGGGGIGTYKITQEVLCCGETEARSPSRDKHQVLWEQHRLDEHVFSHCPLVVSYLNFS